MAVAALVWLVLVLALGSAAAFAVTDGHPVGVGAAHAAADGRQGGHRGRAGGRRRPGRQPLRVARHRPLRPLEGGGARVPRAPGRGLRRGQLRLPERADRPALPVPLPGSQPAARGGGDARASRGWRCTWRRCSCRSAPASGCARRAPSRRPTSCWPPASAARSATSPCTPRSTGSGSCPRARCRRCCWPRRWWRCCRPARERPRSLVTGGAALLASVLAAAVLIVPATLAQRYLERSYEEPAAAALSDAHRAGRLDRLSGRPDLATARALLRTGDTAGALAAARRAAGAEPKFWVAWQVLAETAAREAQQRSGPGRARAGAAACSAAAARAPGRGAGHRASTTIDSQPTGCTLGVLWARTCTSRRSPWLLLAAACSGGGGDAATSPPATRQARRRRSSPRRLRRHRTCT